MTARSKRRGVETVPLYADITPEAKSVIDAIAGATGARKNFVIEQIMAHIDVDDAGVPTWWPVQQQEQLPMTG
ncbi:hypothetical protein [Calidifontibacter terrae]